MDYKDNPHFCLLPFMALNTRPNGGVKPCSEVKDMPPIRKETNELTLVSSKNDYHSLTDESLDSVWNSEFMKDFRMNRINGKYSKFCEVCYKQESNGIHSKRQTTIQKYYEDNKHLVKEAAENNGHMSTMPVWWELRLSSICNEACRFCIPQTSSKLREELKDLYYELSPTVKTNTEVAVRNHRKYGYLGDNENFVQELFNNASNIKYLELHGGEPTNDKNVWRVVEHLINTGDAGHIHLHIHTNIHSLKQKHIDLWKHFKSGWIGASIDAYDNENEYIRHGSKWQKIEENLKLLNGLDNWEKWVTSTVSVYNVCTIDKLVTWFIEYANKHNMHDLNWQCWPLTIPELMMPELVPYEIRQQYITRIQDIKNTHNNTTDKFLDTVIAILNSTYEPTLESQNEFADYTRMLDKNRNQNFIQTFPHLKGVFNFND